MVRNQAKLIETQETIDRKEARRGIRLLFEAIGKDPDCESLADTWERRVPKTFEMLTDGEREAAKPTMRTFDVSGQVLDVKTGIPVYSLCEHHLLPYHGTATVAYRPNESVMGLSKLVRYVRSQSWRLTMQEALMDDIASSLADELDAEMAQVQMNATHLCEEMRGIEKQTTTSTHATAGEPTATEREQFQRAAARPEGS